MRTVFVVAVFVMVVAGLCAPTTAIQGMRRRDLEERVSRTAFGREMLSVVKAQLNTTSGSSFRGVQDFLDQIYKRVVNEQISEAMLHASHVTQCKASLKKLLETTHAKNTIVTDLQSAIKRDQALQVSIPASIEKHKVDIKANEKKIKHYKDILAMVVHYRKNSHETYKRKFVESKQIVEAVQKIVNKMNLFYPGVHSKAASFFEQFGATSSHHLSSLVAVAEELYNQEMMKPTANTEHIRSLLTLLDEEIRKYMTRLNTAEKRHLDHNTKRQNALLAKIAPLQTRVNNDTAAITADQTHLEKVSTTLASNTHEEKLQSRLLTAVKAQLKTQSSFCKAQTAGDKKEATFRTEQRKTVRALQQIVLNHIAKHQRQLAAQAQAQALKRQAEIAEAKRRLEEAQKRIQAGKQPVDYHLETPKKIPVPTPPVVISHHNNSNATHLPTHAKTTCKSILASNATAESGVYILETGAHTKFKAYCDMTTNGGGWMLAYKQYEFSSGSVKYNSKLLGTQKFLSGFSKTHSAKDSTRDGSLILYGHPTEMLFQSSVASNWFTTGALGVWQDYQIGSTDRFCLLRTYNTSYTKFTLSPSWDNTKTAMWADADVQMMADEHPTISAITIGQSVQAQKAPQCMAPNCGSNRHGRYNGYCQDNSKGEGNWLIFIR